MLLKFRPLFLLVTGYGLLATFTFGLAVADTIRMNGGRELKGIVVEDYKDRLTLSTADGEISVMKSDIMELDFNTEEDNLIRLAEQAHDRRNYQKAYSYYDMALKSNPNSKRAKDGLVFVQGHIVRQDELKKEADVKRQADIEQYGASIDTKKKDEDEFKDATESLKRSAGIALKMRGSQPEIDTVDRDSAAYEGGMRRGDLLVAIWGRLTGYMSLTEVMDRLLEKGALEIKCTIERTVDVKTAGGIGASFSMEFDGLTISNIKEGRASFDAGLNKNDLIVAIDGKSTRYMPLKKAIELIRDAKEDAVKLTLRREVVLWRR